MLRQALHSSGEALGYVFPPSGQSLLGGDLWWDCVPASPAHLDVGLRSFAGCVGVTQPAFSFFFRGKCSICSCRFSAFMGGSEVRVHSVATVVPNLISTRPYGSRVGTSDCLSVHFIIPVLDRENWVGTSMGQVCIVSMPWRGSVPLILGESEKRRWPGKKCGAS